MAGPASLGELGLGVVGEAIAFAAGFAAARAMEPVGVGLAQEAWKIEPIRAPDAATMAAGVAQGQVDHEEAALYALQHGYDATAFAALVNVANTGPALGYAYEAWRRGALDDGQFKAALKRTGLEDEWREAMEALKDALLEPAALATAIHRGIVGGAGLLIREPPVGEGKVPSVPRSDLDAVAEAAGSGITAERLRILVGNTGLPLSLGEMLQLLNRGHVEEDDVRRSVAQSNVRNEYMDVALELRRRLLTPHEYAEANLRGWIETAEMHAGTALVGMEQDDADLLFKLLGRPIPLHQVTTGLARGGTYDGPTGDIPEAFIRSLKQGSIRPEWYNIAYANRYSFPAAFVLRALTQAGDLSEKEAHDILLFEAWEPELAAKVSKRWAKGTGAKADPHVAKAQTQLWTALHKSYIAEETAEALARETFDAIGIDESVHAAILGLWDRERDLVTATLTPAQIKKAAGESKITRDEAIVRLGRLGMDAADAAILLDE